MDSNNPNTQEPEIRVWRDPQWNDLQMSIPCYRDERTQCVLFALPAELLEGLRERLGIAGIDLEAKEMPHPFGLVRDFIRLRDTVENIYSVQGKTRREGEDWTYALEELIADYAKVK